MKQWSMLAIVCWFGCVTAGLTPAAPSTMPASVKGASSSVVAEVNSSDWITLTWGDIGPGVYYRVFRNTKAGFAPDYYNEVSPGLSADKFDDDRLSPDTTYYYQVYATQSKPPFTSTYVGAATGRTMSDK